MTTREDRLLIAAVNQRVQRGRRVARGDIERPRFTPPRCYRPGCNRPADIEEKDYTGTRPYWCSARCFRIERDHAHGSVFDEHHRRLDCGTKHGSRRPREALRSP